MEERRSKQRRVLRRRSEQCTPLVASQVACCFTGPTACLLWKGPAIKFISLEVSCSLLIATAALMKLCRSLKNNSCLITFILLISERKDFLSLMYHVWLAGSPAWPQIHLDTWPRTGCFPWNCPNVAYYSPSPHLENFSCPRWTEIEQEIQSVHLRLNVAYLLDLDNLFT